MTRLIMDLVNTILEVDQQQSTTANAAEINNSTQTTPIEDTVIDNEIDDGDDSGDGTLEHDGEDTDDDKQGIIRTVPNAHLVFKRQNPEGTFDELWIYNVSRDQMQSEVAIREKILSGTDIEINQLESEDGSQTAEMWTVGNVQFLYIMGLSN